MYSILPKPVSQNDFKKSICILTTRKSHEKRCIRHGLYYWICRMWTDRIDEQIVYQTGNKMYEDLSSN